jgi:hypothetical protein
VSATYSSLLPGMLLLGVGAGLLMPTCADSVLGSVPPQQAGVGSATYGTSIQIGGAMGVAVIGSLLSTRYVHRIGAALAGSHPPAAILHQITGSLGGALGVAARLGAPAGPLLARAARTAFMSGSHVSIGDGAIVAALAVIVVAVGLPSRPSRG